MKEVSRAMAREDEPQGDPGGLGAAEAQGVGLPLADDDGGPGLEKAAPASVSEEHLKSVLESLVFVADKPATPVQLARLVKAKSAQVKKLLAELAEDYRGRGIELCEVAGGWQFRSAAKNAPFVRDFVAQKPVRLTRAQLETLAIIAYRQPVTRPEVEEIRGVDSGSAMRVLLDRALIKILGRKEDVGRPLLYGTTPAFLELFGMSSLKDLPTLREFSDLTDESRALFERKMGEPVGDLHAAAQAGDDAASRIASHEGQDEIDLIDRDLGRASDVPPEPPEEAGEGPPTEPQAAAPEEEEEDGEKHEASEEGDDEDDDEDDDDEDDEDDDDDEEE